jgi:hypothetical protein
VSIFWEPRNVPLREVTDPPGTAGRYSRSNSSCLTDLMNVRVTVISSKDKQCSVCFVTSKGTAYDRQRPLVFLLETSRVSS